MSARVLYNLTMASEVVGLVLAALLNCVILLLLVYRSSPSLGSYKYLMMMYALIELTYSIIGFSAGAGAHSTDSAYIVFRPYTGPNRAIAPIFLLQYCDAIFVLLLVLAVHFIYRYLAVSNSEKLSLLQGHRIVFWVLGAVLVGLVCPVLKYSFLGEHESATEHLREEMKKAYNLTMENIVYNGPFYRTCDNPQSCRTPVTVWMTTVIIVGSLIGCFVLMITFGLLCYRTLKNSGASLSPKTLQMQKQLLVALLVQGGIPVVFMYIPISVLWLSPTFGYGFGAYGNITMICIAIYPPLDQLATMYIIKDFRQAIKSDEVDDEKSVDRSRRRGDLTLKTSSEASGRNRDRNSETKEVEEEEEDDRYEEDENEPGPSDRKKSKKKEKKKEEEWQADVGDDEKMEAGNLSSISFNGSLILQFVGRDDVLRDT